MALRAWCALTIMASTAAVCMAQQTSRPSIIPGDTKENLLLPTSGSTDLSEEQFFGGVFLPNITQAIIALAGAFAFVFMIIGGIQILTAYGNEEKIASGKKTVTYAIVGLLIAILAYAIVSIVSAIRI